MDGRIMASTWNMLSCVCYKIFYTFCLNSMNIGLDIAKSTYCNTWTTYKSVDKYTDNNWLIFTSSAKLIRNLLDLLLYFRFGKEKCSPSVCPQSQFFGLLNFCQFLSTFVLRPCLSIFSHLKNQWSCKHGKYKL